MIFFFFIIDTHIINLDKSSLLYIHLWLAMWYLKIYYNITFAVFDFYIHILSQLFLQLISCIF